MIELDHFSLGVRNIYEGAHRLREETGLDNYENGLIPPGTANRIVPLPNDTYIELESWIIPETGDEATGGKWYVDATVNSDSWMFWALSCSTFEELEAVAERLGSFAFTAESVLLKPNGEMEGWSVAPASVKPWAAGLPNFYWYPGDHPCRTPVNHRRPFTGVAWMEVGGDPAVMEEHVTSEVFERLPLRFIDEPPGLYAVAIGTEDGDDVVIRRPSATSIFPRAMAEIEITQDLIDKLTAGA